MFNNNYYEVYDRYYDKFKFGDVIADAILSHDFKKVEHFLLQGINVVDMSLEKRLYSDSHAHSHIVHSVYLSGSAGESYYVYEWGLML